MTQVLITGGAGFIGSHLGRALMAAGHRVVVLDDLSAGARANLTGEERFVEGSILDPAALNEAMSDVEAVVHLAAAPAVQEYVENWVGTSRRNLTGALCVLDAARHRDVPVINASSCAVYGEATSMPLTEQSATRPISGYGADKLSVEHHAEAMSRMLGARTVSMRFFNVYGPRQMRNSPYSGVITQFLDCWVGGRTATIFGDGEQTRDFIYVDDIAAALMRAIDHGLSGKTGIFNVCTGRPTSLNALVAAIGTATGTPLHNVFSPAREGDILESFGDPSHARTELGFTAQTDLADGLAATAEWFAANPLPKETVTPTPQGVGAAPD